MNYFLIAHEADSSYFDRCGDFNRQRGNFQTHYSGDPIEFGEQWALAQYTYSWDDLIVLINGKPDDKWNDEEQDAYDEVERIRSETYARYTVEAAQAAENRKKIEAEEAETKRKQDIERQRQADLLTFQQLKKKLGV